jgi:hyperosmotically inducible protein
MKIYLKLSAVLFILTAAGCAPAIIAGGVAGTYNVATDERTMGTMFDDSTITTKVKTALIEDGLVKARHIDVDTIDGHVMLTGVMESGLQEKRAVEIAETVSGVLSVKNNLQVGSKSIGQSIDDKLIGSKIKAKLINEAGVPSMSIDVDVNKGVVTLSGVVKDPVIKAKVIEIAEKTYGTIEVVDNITVTSSN